MKWSFSGPLATHNEPHLLHSLNLIISFEYDVPSEEILSALASRLHIWKFLFGSKIKMLVVEALFLFIFLSSPATRFFVLAEVGENIHEVILNKEP